MSPKISVPSVMAPVLTPQMGTAPLTQSFTGNLPTGPGAGVFPFAHPSSHPLPVASSTEIMPPLQPMGVIPPQEPFMAQRYFGTHNAAQAVENESAPRHPTFGGRTGLDSFPKHVGGGGSQMSNPSQIPEAYGSSPSGLLGPSTVLGATPVNYGLGGTAAAEPLMHGGMIGPPATGLYQQKPRLDPNLMPSVVCS